MSNFLQKLSKPLFQCNFFRPITFFSSDFVLKTCGELSYNSLKEDKHLKDKLYDLYLNARGK